MARIRDPGSSATSAGNRWRTSEWDVDGFSCLRMTLRRAPRAARPGIAHLQALDRVEDDLRDDHPGVAVVVGGNAYQGASLVLVAPRHGSYVAMYELQNFLPP